MADNKIQVLLTVDDQGTASLQRFGREVQAVGNTGRTSFGQVQQASAATTTSLTTLGTAARAMGTALAAVGVAQFAKSAIDTAIHLDSMNRAMVAVYGSAQTAAGEMEYLRATAERTGQNVYTLVDSYNKFSASAKNTALEGEGVRKVFAAMSETGAVLGLSNEKMSLSFNALAQMAAKGTVQMEELKTQLGDHLPGSVAIAARAMDMTTKEFMKAVAAGEILAEDLLPRMAEELHNTYGAAAETAALESGQAAVNRLSQAWTEFKANIVDVSAIVGAINFVSGALAGLSTALNRAKQQAADEVAAMAGEVDATRVQMLQAQAARLQETIAQINRTPIDLQADLQKQRLAEMTSELGQVNKALDIITGSKTATKELFAEFDTGFQNVQTVNGAFGETPPILDKATESALAVGEAFYQQGAAVEWAETRVNDAIFAGEKLSLAELDLSRKTDDAAKSKDKAAGAAGRATTAKRAMVKASNDAAKAAKDLAAEQKRLADEAERTGRAMIEDAAKRRELTLEFTKNLTDTSAAYDTLGITSRKAYEDQVQAATDAYERILSIEELTDSERARLREGLQKTLIELEDDYLGKVEEITGAIAIAWEDLTEDTKQVLHDWVEDAIKMEFDSVGDAFEGLAESILNVWIDLLAKMIAEWAISGIASLFGGGNLLGGISSGLGGLLGGVPIIGDLFGKSGGSLADWGLTAAGTSSVIGGASSLLGGGASSAAFDWGLNSFGAPALGGGAAAAGAATIFGEQAAAGFTASLDTAMAGGLEWAAIPGKEFFGTGASGAAGGGAGAGLSTGAMVGGGAIMGVGALIAMGMGNKAQQEFYSPRYGNVPFNDYGHDDRADMLRAGSAGYSWVSEAQPGSMSGSGDAGITQTVADLEAAFVQFEANTRIVLDVLAAAGDGVASLGQQLEDGTLSTAAFVDAIAGYDVSIQDTASLTSLASEAARGNGNAMDSLRAALQSMGMGADQAEVAALSLVAASNNQSAALYAASSAASSAAGAISGMVSNINTLSRTPLNIRVGVETYRIDNSNPYAEHASGGIFAGPTLIPSIRGTRHLVGEAGQAEAITPLHAGPKTRPKLHDAIKAIGSRPVAVPINLDGRQIATATMPYVDAHVAAKATRGQLGHQTVYK